MTSNSFQRFDQPAPRRNLLDLFLFIACLLTAVLAISSLCSGCATSPTALTAEQQWYQAGTNATAYLTQLAPSLPFPASSAAQAIAAIAAAGLAAWNAWQQNELTKLKNGQGLALAARASAEAFAAGHTAGLRANLAVPESPPGCVSCTPSPSAQPAALSAQPAL